MPTEEGQKLRHACSTCCRSFSNKRDLVKHQYMHREKPNLVCLHCNKTYTTESNYRRHINALQNVEKKGYNCGNCGSLFRRLKDLEQHHELKHRDDKVFRCKVCQAEFSWHENLLKHQQVHEVNPHICTVCNHEFIDMTSLLVHRRTHHLPLSSSAAAEPPHKATRLVISQQPEASVEKPFTCHICGRRFKFDFSYQAHLDAHVIPASGEKSVDVGRISEPPSHLSKPVYVQMDSEGIIDLPAFSSSTNEDVEIIVEVGNVMAAAAGTPPVLLQIPMIPDKDDRQSTTCMKSEMDKITADDGQLLRTSELLKTEQRKDDNSVTGIIDSHDEQKAPGSGSVGKNGRDSALRKADENEGPPEIDRMDFVDGGKPWPAAITAFNSYNTRPKKPTKRKRERVPFQFNCVMTDDKPFVCCICGEAFRWEISLQVHTKVHTEGKVPGVRKIYNSAGAADKKKVMKCKEKVKNSENATGEPGMKKSRIVYRRDSSDEEDVEEDAFAFGNDPEEEERSQIYHGKKFGQRTLRPDNADDMLQEYLVGNESFISLEESSAHAENEMEDYCVQPEEGVLQNKLKEKQKTFRKKLPDDSWRKGKAILRKKRTWKQSKHRAGAETDALHSDSDEKSVCRQATVGPETQRGGLVESLGNYDVAYEHSELDARPLNQQDVMDADEDKKRPSCPHYMVEQGCLDDFHAAASAAAVTEGSDVGLNDDRIVMAEAYAFVALPDAERGLLQNGVTKEEPLVDDGAEQCEDARHFPVAMDTDHQEIASEQVQNMNASGSIAFSSSLHHQIERRADDAVKLPTFGVVTKSEPHEIQQNISVSVKILSQSAEIEPHTLSAGLVSSQGAEAEPHTTPAGLISSQGAETEPSAGLTPQGAETQPHTTQTGLIPLQGAETEPHTTLDGLTPSQAAEAVPHMTSAGLIPSLRAETDTIISTLQLGEKESNATAYESKHDNSCSVRVCYSAENGEHAKDSMGDTRFSQPAIKDDVSVSRITPGSDQHCLTEQFFPALTSSASATPSLSEGKNALSPKQDIIAGSIYSASSEPDQILVKDATLRRKHVIKQRNVRQFSSLFQSFNSRCFLKKGHTLKKSFLKKSVRGGSVVIPSNVSKSAQGTITKRNNCGQCGKHFTSDRSLKRHRMRHGSLKTVSFKCSYCLKRFSTMASLDRHLISLHVSTVASCETCHKQFTTVDSFTLHQQHGCVFSAFERK